MPGIPYNATLTFAGTAIGNVVGLQVETPEAEVADLTGKYDPPNKRYLVPTGSYTGGSITVDYMADTVPTAAIGTVGALAFNSTALSMTFYAILQSATVEARVGDIVRGTIKFLLTDYTGT